MIGRILCKTRPEVATEILNLVTPGAEHDLSRIFFFYSRFDAHKPKGSDVNTRRIFTAVMLKLYHPQVLTSGIFSTKYGFVRNIAACFSCKSQSITRNIREVVIMYRAYNDFQEMVDKIVELIKNDQ